MRSAQSISLAVRISRLVFFTLRKLIPALPKLGKGHCCPIIREASLPTAHYKLADAFNTEDSLNATPATSIKAIFLFKKRSDKLCLKAC